MKKKAIIIVSLLVFTLGGLAWFLIACAPVSNRKPAPETAPPSLIDPTLHSERTVAPAETVLAPSPTPEPPAAIDPPPAPPPGKTAPLRMYTSNIQEPTPEPKEAHHGFYAPKGRLVKCHLVNTVDSSNLSTPIIGQVDDDLIWDGHLIIGKCSEVHAIAQVDKARERIASEGAVLFVLFDPDPKNAGLGKELVVKGEVLDREDNPQFRTYGITNASAGLRGVVITQDNLAAVKLFVATFISGISSGFESTQNTIFGQQPTTNGAGVGNLPGTVINPVVGGAQAVLDRYAQIILDSIERDGFFIRVGSSKTFYVYIKEDIDTGKATVGGSSRFKEVQEEFLEDRKLEEKVTEPRSVRDERAFRSEQNAQPNFMVDPQLNNLTNRLDQTSGILQERSREMQTQSFNLGQPNPTPVPQ